MMIRDKTKKSNHHHQKQNNFFFHQGNFILFIVLLVFFVVVAVFQHHFIMHHISLWILVYILEHNIEILYCFSKYKIKSFLSFSVVHCENSATIGLIVPISI